MSHDRVEIFVDGSSVSVLESSIVPTPKSLVCLRGETYTVHHVSYTIDYADDFAQRQMVARVWLESKP